MEKEPLVSVLMPAYNAEKYLRQSIESVLNQTFTDFELVILNDGSTDATKEIILSYTDKRVRYVENEQNSGLTFCRNKLIREAKADFLAWLDADDIAYPERLAKQLDFLQKNQDFALVGTWAKMIDENSIPIGQYIKSYIKNEYLSVVLLFTNYFAVSSIMLRKKLLPANGFIPNFTPAEDFDMWVRLAYKYKVAILPQILIDYRVHKNNLTNTQSDKMKNSVLSIYQYQLNNLGIQPSEKELNLHYQLIFGNNFDEVFINKAKNWLQNISKHNQQSGIYTDRILAFVVAHRWAKICFENPKNGIKALSYYWKSELAKFNFHTIGISLSYILKLIRS